MQYDSVICIIRHEIGYAYILWVVSTNYIFMISIKAVSLVDDHYRSFGTEGIQHFELIQNIRLSDCLGCKYSMFRFHLLLGPRSRSCPNRVLLKTSKQTFHDGFDDEFKSRIDRIVSLLRST